MGRPLAAALLGRRGRHGVGRALAQRLVGDGEQVLDVPAKLAARVWVLSVGHGRKSDRDDAVSVAVAAQCAPQLRQVGVEDQAGCCTC
jgi:transposase